MNTFIYGALSICSLAGCLLLVFTDNAYTNVYYGLGTLTLLCLFALFAFARHFIIRPDLAHKKKYAYIALLSIYLMCAALMIIYPEGPPEDAGSISRLLITVVNSLVILMLIMKLLIRSNKLSMAFRMTVFLAISVLVIATLMAWYL